MPISVRCSNPECDKPLRVKDDFAGKRVKCPGCGTAITVPDSAAAAPNQTSPTRTPPKSANRAQGGANSNQSPARTRPAPKRTIVFVEAPPRPWNKTKVFSVILIAIFLFPPFHTHAIVYTNRDPINHILDRNTSFILQPPSQQTEHGHLADPWRIYWGRLFIEMGAAALLAVLFTSGRRKWFAIGAGVLLASGGIAFLIEDPPPRRAPFEKVPNYEPPSVDKKPNTVPSMDRELEGTWKPIQVTRDAGAKGNGKDPLDYLMTIRYDGNLEINFRGVPRTGESLYRIQVDQTKSPKTFKRFHLANLTDSGIYSVEKNKLRMCQQVNGQIPTDFSIAPEGNQGRILFEFERFVPLTPEPEEKKQSKVEPPKVVPGNEPNPLPANVQRAWHNAGAHSTSMTPGRSWFGASGSFVSEHASADRVPAFGFERWPIGHMTTLPAPDQAFGLDLTFTYVIPSVRGITDAELRELTRFQHLQALDLRSSKITDVGLAELAKLKNLRILKLDNVKLTDAGLKELAALKNLQSLSLQFVQLTNSSLRELARFENLQTLNLGSPWLTDAGLKELAGLKNLQSLDLNGSRITDSGLKELAGFERLRTLRLERTPINGVGLKELARLPQLQELDLAATQLNEAGLKEVAGLLQLRQLDLGRMKNLTEIGLRELAPLKNLHTLHLDDTSDRTLAALREINLLHTLTIAKTQDNKRPSRPEEVTSLYLVGSQVSDAGLKELTGLQNLQSLDFSSSALTDSGLKELAAFKQLQTLKLGGNFSGEGFKHLAALQQLQSLQLSGTSVGLKHLAGLPQLQSLTFHTCAINNEGLKEVGTLKQLRSLCINNNSGNCTFTDSGLKELGGLQQLQKLDLWFAPITDAGLKEIARLKQLESLNLYNTPITGSGLKDLTALKQLRTLELPLTQVTGVGLKDLAALPQLQTLNLLAAKVSDLGMRELAGFHSLQKLLLTGKSISDEGLKYLAGLNQLQELNLNETSITDAGLRELAGLASLQDLRLERTGISNAGLKSLAGLKNLRVLNVRETKVTEAGLNELASLPQLRISYDRGKQVVDVGTPKTDPEPKTDPKPVGEGWQKDPTAFAGLYFGGNLKKRTPDEARDLKYPKDVEKKVAGATVEWIGKVLPGPVSGGKNGNVLIVSPGQDGTIVIRGSSGYKNGDKYVTIEEQIQSLPILTRVKLTMKIKTPVNAVIAFDGGPMLVLDGDDARVTVVKSDLEPKSEPKIESAPVNETWQTDPTTFANLYFGGNLKKRTADEARDLKIPRDVDNKVAGKLVIWDGKILPGPGKDGKSSNVVVVSAGQDGMIWIRGDSGYKDGDKFITIAEQAKAMPILTRVKVTMKVKTPADVLLGFDGGPMIILAGDDAKVTVAK